MSPCKSEPSFALSSPNSAENTKRRVLRRLVLFFTLALAGLIATFQNALPINIHSLHHHQKEQLCTQYDVLVPSNPLWKAVGEIIGADAFKSRAVDWLSGAIKVPQVPFLLYLVVVFTAA